MALTTVQLMKAASALKIAADVVGLAVQSVESGSVTADIESVSTFVGPRVEDAVQGIPFAQAASEQTIGFFTRFLAGIVLDTVTSKRSAA